MADMQALIDAEKADAQVSATVSQQTYESGRRAVVLVLVLVVGLALALAVALYVVRLIVTPLRKVSGVLEAMAGGDLTALAEVSSRDELGRWPPRSTAPTLRPARR